MPTTKWAPFERASGPHKGVSPVNVHPLIFDVCNDLGVINSRTYQDLHTTITLDGALDLLEMKDALASWQSAEARNQDANKK
jgi:hypothetical protein